MEQTAQNEFHTKEIQNLSFACDEARRVLSRKSPDLVQKSEVGNILMECINAADGYIKSAESDYVTVALAGEFSAGKSTIINALLEEEILPSGDRPLTSINVQIQHSDKVYIRISWNKDLSLAHRRIFLTKYVYWLRSWRQLNLMSPQSELFCDSVKVSNIRDFLKKLETERKSAKVYAADTIEIGIPFPEQWRKVRFLDIPGSGAITSVQKQIQDSYENQFVLLYTVDAQRIGSKLSDDLIQQYSLLGAKLLVVINKWDTIPKKEQKAKLEEAEACYGVKAVPFAGLSYLVSRLVATKRLKVKDLIKSEILNLTYPMHSQSWHARKVESNAESLASFLQKRSNFVQFFNELERTLNEQRAWNITQYKKQIKKLIQAYNARLDSLQEDIKHKTSEKSKLVYEQERTQTLCASIESDCRDSVASYRNSFEKAFHAAIDAAKNHLRDRARAFADDELNKQAGGNWNVISNLDYINHYDWNDAGTILDFHSRLYRVHEECINALNIQLSALDNSIPKLYSNLDIRQLELDLKDIISTQKTRLFGSLANIAHNQDGYPSFLESLLDFVTHAMQNYIQNKRNWFYFEIDSITCDAFNSLNAGIYVKSYKEGLSPIYNFTDERRRAEKNQQQRINLIQREIEMAEDELNIWRCEEYAVAMSKLNDLTINTN